MGKLLEILIGIFIFGIIGNVINNILSFVLFVYRIMFEFIYFISSIFGLTLTGTIIINLAFYYMIYKTFDFMIGQFTNN